MHFTYRIDGQKTKVTGIYPNYGMARDSALDGEVIVSVRHDSNVMARAESYAELMNEYAKERGIDVKYIAIDNGEWCSPRYDVIEAPKVGDKVSYAFNGDYYPDGEIVRIGDSMRVITTSTGNKYWRRKKTGRWILRGTWTLVQGHRDDKNPCF